jgi:predicted nucleic acid-binding protein
MKLADSGSAIIVHQFVLHETWSLIQARLGHEALDVFERDFLPVFVVEPVSEETLRRAMSRCRVARRRHLSLTDCVTVEFAEERGIRSALAFDRHLREAGLRLPTQADWPGA